MKRVQKVLTGMILAGMLAGCGTAGQSATAQDPAVAAPTGTYVGTEENGVMSFKGIRYGTFTPFQAASDVTTTTEDTIEAKTFGDNCIQPYSEVEVASQGPNSHDCLYLNIWTKDTTTTDKPVIVFIHGGSYIWGGTSDPTYDGQFFVRNLPEGEDCVFITMNYRLSFMGGVDMSSLEGYTEEYADAKNLSKLDQTQALKWIQENISAFGGDPDNVTIMGHSAGGGAVEMLVADADCHAYFNRAIINSGSDTREMISDEIAAEQSQEIFEILGVTSVEQLVNLTDEQISEKMEAINEVMHSGLRSADGNVISKTWWEDLVNGAGADIDLMIGSVNGEEDWNAVDWDHSVSEPVDDPNVIRDMLETIETDYAGTYGRLYSLSLDGFYEGFLAMGEDPVKQAMDFYNQVCFVYPSLLLAQAQAEHNPNTYVYYWEYAPAMEDVLEYAGDSAEVSPYGRAMHTMDICYIFGTKDGYTTLTGDPEKMSDDMIAKAQAMVYSFAKTGDPNNDLVSGWEPYNAQTQKQMVISADGSWNCVEGFQSDIMDYFKQLQPYLGE